MADSLDPVAVGIQYEGGEVIGVILPPKTWLTVAAAAGMKGRRVKGLHRRSIGRAETQVHATRRHYTSRLDGDRELDAERARHRTIVRAPLLKIDDANNPKRPQHSIVEATAALQVADGERNVVEHFFPVLVRSDEEALRSQHLAAAIVEAGFPARIEQQMDEKLQSNESDATSPPRPRHGAVAGEDRSRRERSRVEHRPSCKPVDDPSDGLHRRRALWVTLGGHFVEVLFRNRLRHRIGGQRSVVSGTVASCRS